MKNIRNIFSWLYLESGWRGSSTEDKTILSEAEGSGMKKQTITALFSCDIKTV